MKNRIFLLSILLIFSLFLRAEEKVILKVFELPDPKAADAFSRADRAVIKAFKEKYPYIELRSFSGIKIENMDLDAGPLMAIAGGVSPDIIYVNFRQSATYIEKGFLYPLDDYVKNIDPEELSFRIYDPVWPVVKRQKGNEGEEHIWSIPYETLVRVLMYRKDLFRKVGLDPDKPPQTWNELLSYAQRMSIPEEEIYGITFSSGPQCAWDWITFLWSAGGEAVRKNPQTGEWYASFDDDAAVNSMYFYMGMCSDPWIDSTGKQQHGYANRYGDWGYMWFDGQIGMRIDYMDDKSLGKSLDPNLYGVAPVPTGPTGMRGSELNCRMMGIFSGAGETNNGGLGERDAKKVKDAAFKYIWFYDSDEARKIRLQVMIDAGYGKMMNPVFLRKYGFEDFLQYTPTGWEETFNEALANGKPEPYGKNTQKIYEYMSYPLNEIIDLNEKGKLGQTEAEKKTHIKEILTKAVAKTNRKMLGKISPEERYKRNRTAVIVAIIIFSMFIYVIYRVWQIFTPKTFEPPSPKTKKINWT
ncbi:MAG TPA: extracellular solute-binding protein, partial [Candidatus Cloacimonadota bacterium]|nr:extracellular solute-binding protein [Candidatus Cloacimonadota bacterium]